VMDDPTSKYPSPLVGEGREGGGAGRRSTSTPRRTTPTPIPSPQGGGEQRDRSKIHKPALDEMGIALSHEVAPHRPGASKRGALRKPTLDEMGPGVESIPAEKSDRTGPRSTLGRPGMRGGWKPRQR
jgi:excinuclease ABC subunit B